ncbi:MAG: formyl transferase [Deltaproteobacteria bacterium]|nr:MAG: formyl transferase [Deltaproteobacteria bacterium]
MGFRLGWFSTGRDEAARELLRIVWRKIKEGFIPAQLSFVFCNREKGEEEESDRFLELCKRLGLFTLTLSERKFLPDLRRRDKEAWRAAYHKEVARLVEPFGADVIMLAGYMLIVSPQMCRAFPMVNLHPALPGGPTGSWQEVIWKLISERASRSGVMIHLVTEELDRGPVLTYCSFPIKGGKLSALWREVEGKEIEEIRREVGEGLLLFRVIREEGVKRELPLIALTLKTLAEGRMKLKEGRVLDEEGRPVSGIDLTEEVERALREGL